MGACVKTNKVDRALDSRFFPKATLAINLRRPSVDVPIAQNLYQSQYLCCSLKGRSKCQLHTTWLETHVLND